MWQLDRWPTAGVSRLLFCQHALSTYSIRLQAWHAIMVIAASAINNCRFILLDKLHRASACSRSVGDLLRGAVRLIGVVVGLFAAFGAAAHTAVLANEKAAYVLPDIGFNGSSCPSSYTVEQVANSIGPSHGVSGLGTDSALVAYFGQGKLSTVKVLDRTTVNTLDLANLGYGGYGTVAVAPAQSHALAADGASVYVIPSPFDGTGVSKLNLPGNVLAADTQAIAFDAQGRAFVAHTSGVSVILPPYTSVAFTMPRVAEVGLVFQHNVVVTPDGGKVLVTNDNKVLIYSAPLSQSSVPEILAAPLEDSYALDGIALLPDGTKAIVTITEPRNSRVAVISAPFNSSSTFEFISLPRRTDGPYFQGFEDVSVSADGRYALVTGQLQGNDPLMLIKGPFTSAGATVCPIPIPGGRGAGAVRFLPPNAVTETLPVPSVPLRGSILLIAMLAAIGCYLMTVQRNGSRNW